MPKEITITIDDNVYDLFKKAADDQNQTISDYIQYAALTYMLNDNMVKENIKRRKEWQIKKNMC